MSLFPQRTNDCSEVWASDSPGLSCFFILLLVPNVNRQLHHPVPGSFNPASLLSSWGVRAADGTINKAQRVVRKTNLGPEPTKELHWSSGVVLFFPGFPCLDAHSWTVGSRRPKWLEISGHSEVLNLDQSRTHSQSQRITEQNIYYYPIRCFIEL